MISENSFPVTAASGQAQDYAKALAGPTEPGHDRSNRSKFATIRRRGVLQAL
ncbi:hypothetical protein CSE45_1292 [Citreicella sp. SE45]|nr:hypothetical protein CSE45_1292 [Citreicella sp. SE45]